MNVATAVAPREEVMDAAPLPEPDVEPEVLDAPLTDEERPAFEAIATQRSRKPGIAFAIAATIVGLLFPTLGGNDTPSATPSVV